MNTRTWVLAGSGAASFVAAAGIALAMSGGAEDGAANRGLERPGGPSALQPGGNSTVSLAEARLGCDHSFGAPVPAEQVSGSASTGVSSGPAAAGNLADRAAIQEAATNQAPAAAKLAAAAPSSSTSPAGASAVPVAAVAAAPPPADAVSQAPAGRGLPASRFADAPAGSLPAVTDAPAAQPGPAAKPGLPPQGVSRFADDGDTVQVQQARVAPFPGKMKPMGSP